MKKKSIPDINKDKQQHQFH